MKATIEELWRYPVKSMQGERVSSCAVDTAGLAGDRRYGVVTPEGYVLSGKSEPRILLAAARTRSDGEVEITLPHGVTTASDDPQVDELLTAWLDRPVRLHRAGEKDQFLIHHQLLIDDPSVTKDFPTPPGAYFDSRSTLHLLSRSSLAAAGAAYPAGQWDVRRFRPNIVVSFGKDTDGFAENAWVGETLVLGGVAALVRKATERCVLTTRAQPGLDRDLDIYRTLAKANDTNLGIYLVAQASGVLSVGDPVYDKKEGIMTTPRLVFVHADQIAPTEVVTQMHGDERVSVWLRFLEFTDKRMVALTDYDPNLVLERHGHKSDHSIFVVDGEVTISGHHCPTGTLIVLEHGADFGPIIAGPKGARILEHYMGDPAPVPSNKEEYYAILEERGIKRLPNPQYTPPPGSPDYAYDGTGDVAS